MIRRILLLSFLLPLPAGVACGPSGKDAAAPNPELKVPDVPPGRGNQPGTNPVLKDPKVR